MTQATKDAIADAETLMAVAMDKTLPVMPEWRSMRLALWDARSGNAVALAHLSAGHVHMARQTWAAAARAAFRAVPELRG